MGGGALTRYGKNIIILVTRLWWLHLIDIDIKTQFIFSVDLSPLGGLDGSTGSIVTKGGSLWVVVRKTTCILVSFSYF